ncbi:hypothetical protein [Aquicoccus sp.]|uniref:hypothetical protein n=1 Tax=Aquicoccus sp. TaxID=2055851 RepID=UPI00356B2AEF
MTSRANSTIAALCYATPSNLDFTVLAAELEEALRSNPALDVRVSSQYDDFIFLDLSGLRICLAFCDFTKEFKHVEALRPYAECLVMAVGTREDMPSDGPLFERRNFVFDGLVERVESHHPPDRFLRIELVEAFSEDLYDAVIDHIWQVLQDETDEAHVWAEPEIGPEITAASSSNPSSEEEKPRKAHVSPVTDIMPDDVLDDLARRYDVERSNRAAGSSYGAASLNTVETPKAEPEPPRIRPTHPAINADRARSRTRPNRPRTAPRRDKVWLENARLRMALYPPEDELPQPQQAKPLVHRAAIHSMNASVIAFSLPLGAAVLTYTILGRESFEFSGRMAALTGFIMGTSQTQLGAQLLSAFV